MKMDSSKKAAKQSEYLAIDDPFERDDQIMSFKVPCVVSAIDPEYNQDASRHSVFRKFNVKTDILRLRDITRKKFVMYVTEQHRLKRARDQEIQTRIYQQAMDFVKMASRKLDSIEREAFREMQAENERLRRLQLEDKSDELKECILQQQELATDVKNVHRRFLFLLKLIKYFSGDQESVNILMPQEMPGLNDYAFLKDDLLADDISKDLVKQLDEYVVTTAKPFLAKKSYLNATIWMDGYENTRRKLFNVYNQMTSLAVLNHIGMIIHEKFLKTYKHRVAKPIVRTDPSYLKERKLKLQENMDRVLEDFEKKYIKAKRYQRIKGIAPVILDEIREDGKKDEKKSADNQLDTIGILEKTHSIVMGLLNDLDTVEPSLRARVEEETRLRRAREKKMSRKALNEENRFHNWIEHYKKHFQNK